MFKQPYEHPQQGEKKTPEKHSFSFLCVLHKKITILSDLKVTIGLKCILLKTTVFAALKSEFAYLYYYYYQTYI